MAKFNKRPDWIEAFRYGVQATGGWTPNAVSDLEAWMRTFDSMTAPLTKPQGAWNPPTQTDLYVWAFDPSQPESDPWAPLLLGQWVVRGRDANFYVITDSYLKTYYEIATGV